jgi:glutathione S-transferase
LCCFLTCIKDNTRSEAIKLVAKANKLELDVKETVTGASAPADYLKYNSLGKIPTFVGSDGYVLTECIAIAIYSMFSSAHDSHPSFMMKEQ